MKKHRNKRKISFYFLIVILAILVFAIFVNKNTERPDESDSSVLLEENQVVENVTFQESAVRDDFSYIDKVHWGHMPLSYGFNYSLRCGESEVKKVRLAFQEINRLTNGSVSFIEVYSLDPDISITCSFDTNVKYGGGEVKRDLGKAYSYIYTEKQNQFSNAIIDLPVSTYSNGWYPLTELHEILHAFGYLHNETYRYSIMYPMMEGQDFYNFYEDDLRDKAVDKWIIEDLKGLYGNSS